MRWSDLASQPGAANVCHLWYRLPLHAYTKLAVLSPLARHCKLVFVRSDLASEPGAAKTCTYGIGFYYMFIQASGPGSLARYCKVVPWYGLPLGCTVSRDFADCTIVYTQIPYLI